MQDKMCSNDYKKIIRSMITLINGSIVQKLVCWVDI